VTFIGRLIYNDLYYLLERYYNDLKNATKHRGVHARQTLRHVLCRNSSRGIYSVSFKKRWDERRRVEQANLGAVSRYNHRAADIYH
jgi:hypothetical protein